MNINTQTLIKSAGIAAAAGVVITILSYIPFLGCLIAPLGLVAAAAAGVLYVLIDEGEKVELIDGAAGGAISGAAYSLAASIVGIILSLMIGLLFSGSDAAGLAATGAVGVVGAIIGILISGVLGAIGGGVTSAIQNN